MLGVGVGFDNAGAGSFTVPGPDDTQPTYKCAKFCLICLRHAVHRFMIPDKREGWVESLKRLLKAHFCHTADVEFDYSKIREMGTKLKVPCGSSDALVSREEFGS